MTTAPLPTPPLPATPQRAAGEGEPLLRRAVGQTLRRLRHTQGRTLADVSTAARISTTYLSELERGRKEASSEVLLAVCRALGIAVADLLVQVHPVMARPAPVRVVRTLTATPAPSDPTVTPAAPSSAGVATLRVA